MGEGQGLKGDRRGSAGASRDCWEQDHPGSWE